MRRILLLTLAVPLFGVGRSVAQDQPAPAIDTLIVVGAVRNTPQQVVAFAGLRTGQQLTYRVVQRAIQKLFATGRFDDVRVEQRQTGGRFALKLIVKERPLLQKWTLK